MEPHVLCLLVLWDVWLQICSLKVYKQMENLYNIPVFLFSSLFQEKKLYQNKIFHYLIHFNQLKLYTSIFVIVAIIKFARILDNLFKDCHISYFDFSVILVFFRNLANDNQNCKLLACKIWPLSRNYISELQWFLAHNWESKLSTYLLCAYHVPDTGLVMGDIKLVKACSLSIRRP